MKTPSPPTPPPPEEEPTPEMFTVKQLYNLFSQVRLSSTVNKVISVPKNVRKPFIALSF